VNPPEKRSTGYNGWRPPWLVAVVSLLLSLHACLAFLGVLNRSVTSDETGHLTAGYSYWQFGDYRLQPENGNLPQRWGSLPLLVLRPELDPALDPDDWASSRVWNIAQTFLFETGNNTDFLLLSARSMMLLWSVAAGLLVFWWSRSIWGDTAGVGSLALFTFSPTTLAHGPLVTSDMCAAVCLLAALATWWRMCLQPSFARIVVAGLVTGLAFAAKFSAVLLLPTFIALGAILLAAPDGVQRKSRFLRVSAASLLAGLIATVAIWGFFGFRYSAADQAVAAFDRFYLPWENALAGGGAWTRVIQFARTCQLLPESFLYGFSFVMYFSAERGAFLAGNYSSTGWWWFFPFAFLVKSTVGELLITALLAFKGIPLVCRIRTVDVRNIVFYPLLPLAVFVIVFGAVTAASNLNIGQRHILPLYLILFIAAGALFSRHASKWLRVAGVIAVIIGATETFSNHPHHLAFFNRFAGGPQNGWKLLVDSSLDWGQDVSALGSWIRDNRRADEQVFVTCFGTADPAYEGINGKALSPYYSLGKPRVWFELEPGLYCLSATMLQDVYGIRPGPWTETLEKDFQYLRTGAQINLAQGTWDRNIPENGFHPEHPLWLLDRLRFARLCQYLKIRRPDAVINHTQFVFRLSADEVETAVNKPFSAFVSLMEKAAAERARVPAKP
jgi:4-amino-4-deoxy-L-arabinose transferase-like glycosyltransferase